ncbi:MAG: hypothetical protein ABSD58_17840 [Verrucomicrobiia bacterium]|jgi:hypothetical protein
MYNFETKFGKAADKYGLPARKEGLRDKVASMRRDRMVKEFWRIRSEITKPMIEKAWDGLRARHIRCELLEKQMQNVYGETTLRIGPKEGARKWQSISFYTDVYFEKIVCSTQLNGRGPSLTSCPTLDVKESWLETQLDSFLGSVLLP